MAVRHVIYVSYIRQLGYVVHADGWPQISAPTLKELREELARLRPDADFALVLSRGAQRERARRTGAPAVGGWT